MLGAAALALLAANSPIANTYYAWTHYPITLAVGPYGLTEALAEWVKDGLMVLFFLVVGMELKRELVEGVLADRRQLLLPLVAALSGMAVPAVIFLIVTGNDASTRMGWAIPTATDIAFALAVLLMASRTVPSALKIFLLAIAIFDDLGAILVIAFVYTDGVVAAPLLTAAAITLMMLVLNARGVSALAPYALLAVALAVALYHGGVHTTIAGVITGMMLPLADAKRPSHSPLNMAMHFLHPWVSFVVLPLFAFTAAGVSFAGLSVAELLAPLTLAIALALFLGKQLGIFGASWLLVRLRLVSLPAEVGWRQLHAVSVLAGIGFTMSLFIGALAFEDAVMATQVKLGVLTGSLLSALVGFVLLRSSDD